MKQHKDKLKSATDFIDDLIEAFPEIRNDILDEDYVGLITLQMGCFKRFTQKAIDNNDIITLNKCFDFIERNFHCVEYQVENSIVISYLGKLKIPKNSNIEKLIPEDIKGLINVIHTYNDTPSKNEKFNKFMKDLKKR